MKPCRLCSSKRYATTSWCWRHFREREKAKREEKRRRKDERRKGTKKYEESQRKGLKKQLDVTFSKLIRSVGKCLRCGRGPEAVTLSCSHIYSRRHDNVRWDELNAKCLCFGCHQFWGCNPAEAMDWLKTKRSPEELEELQRRVNTIKRWTVPELRVLLEELTEKLKAL